ncbi:MAG: 6,7-dimethyl-8-ribityllumazine synthase [Acidobacteria bacterium]|nr:MAG: 6,7-dimethyl-8-ribityllumazine synthase [Acidobacteriota bacterium]
MLTLEGSNRAPGMKFAVVVSKFNDFVTARLQAGAIGGLESAGVAPDDICVIKVPGAFEIPFAAKEAASRGSFSAVVCLGCLIRGKTPHFEYISSACAHGITEAASSTGVPMSFGVLTTNSVEEALERAIDGPGNKGWEAAIAAVEMATLQRSLRQPRPSKSVNV